MSKFEPVVEPVKRINVNPKYNFVKYLSEHKTTIFIRDIATTPSDNICDKQVSSFENTIFPIRKSAGYSYELMMTVDKEINKLPSESSTTARN
ncbi:hypothetical protein GJ496_003890 [Pomphorhynchus laevis]|nr:hypothetical protein GJ496_003890 [Pomphorhynchus laevis]